MRTARQEEYDQIREFIERALTIEPEKLTSVDQLADAREMIERAMHTLDIDLAQIRRQFGAEGERDARWWARATHAQRIKGVQRQRLQSLFGLANRMLKETRHKEQKTRERRFVELARPYLGEQRYRKIWRAILEEEQGRAKPLDTQKDFDGRYRKAQRLMWAKEYEWLATKFGDKDRYTDEELNACDDDPELQAALDKIEADWGVSNAETGQGLSEGRGAVRPNPVSPPPRWQPGRR